MKKILIITLIIVSSVLLADQWITASDGESGDNFGYSVSISDDFIVVGSIGTDYYGSNTNCGSIYTFEYTTSWQQHQRIDGSGGANYNFGYDVDISGNYLIGGEPYANFNGTHSGFGYTKELNLNNYWDNSGMIQFEYFQDPYEYMCKSVAISGVYAIVGAPGYNYGNYVRAGKAYMFKKGTNNWDPISSIMYSEDIQSEDDFGRDVSISGDFAVVAAESGVYVYERTGTSTWVFSENINTNGAEKVEIKGYYILVTVDMDNDPNDVILYKYESYEWNEVAEFTQSISNPYFGDFISMYGDMVIVCSQDYVYEYYKPEAGWADMTESRCRDLGFHPGDLACWDGVYVVGSTGYGDNGGAYVVDYSFANVSGHVSLNGGSGIITSVQIKFDSQTYGIPNVYLNPDENGNFSHAFSYDEFDTYDVTYKLYSTDEDYYKEIIENVEINETTSPLTLDITLHPISDPTNVLVSNDENIPAFRNIQDAVEYLSIHNSGTIRILPGTYTGDRNKDIYWLPDMQPEGLHITIKGIGECIIDCGGSESAFKFSANGYYQYNENDVIENLTILNADQGIVIEHGSPVIKNNTIENCTISPWAINTHGAGISCRSSGTIENNEILGNIGNWILECETYGGGIYVENNTESTVLIKNNIVSGNSAYNGGGIYCTGSGKIILDGNEITLNTLVAGSGSFHWPEYGTGIHCETCTDIEVRNNLIYNNLPFESTLYDYSLGLLSNCENVIIENNTIVNNTNQTGIKLKTTSPAIINNNIVSDNRKGICKYAGVTPVITYCCVASNPSGNYINTSPGIGCLAEDTDPELDDEGLEPTYQPLWISDAKSPCIDVGDPALPLDPDDTPADIGAIPAVIHKYDTIELPSPEEDNGWKWLSFPALDIVLDDADIAENVLEDILDPAILDVVEAQDYTIEWNGFYWENVWRQFLRTEGFKFHMNDDFTLEVPGFKVADNTTIVLEGNNVENWVGYWLEETQHVSDAFSDYWSGSNINFIHHQEWTAFYLGRWRIMLYGGCEEPTLSYGDMVVVKCITTINNFHWISGIPVDKTVFAKPEYFTFEEQADYVALYIELDSGNMPQEIGAFVNGECIGATVVEDTLTQINAYTTSAPPGNIELELYYGGRSENQHISSYNCVTSSKPNIIMKQLSTKMSDDAWFIDLREDSSMVPAPTKVSLSNYPNPFNPSTTISYSLPQEGKVSLKIYNVKGQLVKQLIDGSQPEGYYEVVWNGKDNAGRSVASGIYYYQINACGKTLNKKMLLVK